jgi:UDP-N-acetylmuramoyl-tripeptide--D-alanyl-D-alanine ligase
MFIHELYKIFRDHPDISTDSRNIRPDCLFFALKGDKFNGNLFVQEALKKGAGWAVADKHEGPPGERVIRVDDALHTLQQLATYHRRECRFKILAVTGSNGKTTTKELCNAVLGQRYRLYATRGNLNNHIGVPLTLLSMPPDTEIGIVEMGANHPGEIALLCNIAQPDHGLITNIGKAHLEGFGSIKGVAESKGELFSYLAEHNGTSFVNAGNDLIRRMIFREMKNRVAYNSRDTIWAEVQESGLFLELSIHDKSDIIPVKSRLVGKYNAENILAAYAVGKYFGIPSPAISGAIEAYVPDNNRSQFITTIHNEIIMDAYNANPSSMKAAIENFMAMKRPGSLIILGEMLELGDSSAREHQAIIATLNKYPGQKVICIGHGFESPAKSAGYPWYPDVSLLQSALVHSPIKSSFILIKGSRGNKMEKLAEVL